MDNHSISNRRFCVLSGLSGVAGVLLLIVSFAINNGPPPDPSSADLVKFGQQHFANILWGAWLQAVGPVLIVLFAFALVHLAGATLRLAGWMAFLGATILMTVSLIEITFYISAMTPDPAMMRPSVLGSPMRSCIFTLSSQPQLCSYRWALCWSVPGYSHDCSDTLR